MVDAAFGGRVVVLVACLLATTASARPLEPELFDLLSSHPQILSKQTATEAARKDVDRAFAKYLPTVNVTGGIGPGVIDTDQRSQLGLQPFSKPQSLAEATVSQMLFDGFETPAQVRIARLNAEVALRTLEGTRQGVMFDGVSAYLDVLRQKRLVELGRLSEDSIKLQANLEDERVQRGAGIAVDVLQAKARLQIAKERRVALEGAFQNAVSRYIQVFNHPPTIGAMTDPVPPEDLLPRLVDAAIDIALNENPAVIASATTVEVASERRRLAKSGYYPDIDVVGRASYQRNFDLLPGTRRDLSLLVQATWTLFNGFATDATAAKAALEYKASRENHDFVTRSVEETTRIAWQQLITSRERVELLANAVAIASEVFDARRALREAGKETVINVLIAEDEVNNARINLTGARYETLVAVYRVLQSVGRLDGRHVGVASR